MHRVYRQLSPGDVDLGYAGRLPPSHAVHAALEAGSELQARRDRDRWLWLNAQGTPVGRLARRFELPGGQQVESATVHAVIVRDREDSTPEYQDAVRSDRWEVILPEIVLRPE